MARPWTSVCTYSTYKVQTFTMLSNFSIIWCLHDSQLQIRKFKLPLKLFKSQVKWQPCPSLVFTIPWCMTHFAVNYWLLLPPCDRYLTALKEEDQCVVWRHTCVCCFCGKAAKHFGCCLEVTENFIQISPKETSIKIKTVCLHNCCRWQDPLRSHAPSDKVNNALF